MKVFKVLFLVLLSILIAGPSAAWAAEANFYGNVVSQSTGEDGAVFTGRNSSGSSKWSVDSNGNVNTSGNITAVGNITATGNIVTSGYISTPYVIINSATQLSSWAGQSATAGQSYFQCSPNTTYFVDLYMLGISGVTAGNGVSAFKLASFTGVSAILPDASTYSGPAYDVTIILANTGGTGYLQSSSGSTVLYVWPYPGSGATSYGANATTKPQTLHTIIGSAGTLAHYMAAGASYWELDKSDESAIFGLYNSQVSAYVKRRTVLN